MTLTHPRVRALLDFIEPALDEALDHHLFEPNVTDEAELVWAQCTQLDAGIARGDVVQYSVPREPLVEPWDIWLTPPKAIQVQYSADLQGLFAVHKEL